MKISGLIHCTYMYRGLNIYMYIHVCTCVYIHVYMHEYNMFTCTCIYIWVRVRKKTRTWKHSQRKERWGEEECSVFVLIPNLVSRYRWRSGDNIVGCSVLQHTATRCNTEECCTCINTRSWAAVLLEEQEMATHLPHTHTATHTHFITLQCTARCCSTLQDVVAYCNTLRHGVAHCNTLRGTATHCGILQRTNSYFTLE